MRSVFFLTGTSCLSKLRKTVTDNRKNQRFELRLPFEVIRSGQRSQPIAGYTLNMSSNGVLFELTQPIGLGEIIEYYITLPTGQDLEEDVRLRCMGKVVRNHENFAAATMERYEFMRILPGTVDLPSASGAASN
ncbi:MAG: PilZ domain-containing protein [Acidobacteriota bacterium]